MKEQRRRRRLRHLVNLGMQFRFLKLILIAMVLPMALVAACLYYLFFSITAEQIGMPEAVYQHLVPALKKINTAILVGMPLIAIFILFWGLLLSHRIAGPVYRLEKELEKIAKGDFSIRLKFRKRDELGSVAEGVNKVLDQVERLLGHKK